VILYIAGPMTGLPEFNFPAFHKAEDRLCAVGFEVLNPARNDEPSPPTWENWMRLALAQVVRADGVALLRGWEKSKGAQLEVRVAQALGIETFSVDIWVRDLSHLASP